MSTSFPRGIVKLSEIFQKQTELTFGQSLVALGQERKNTVGAGSWAPGGKGGDWSPSLVAWGVLVRLPERTRTLVPHGRGSAESRTLRTTVRVVGEAGLGQSRDKQRGQSG